MKMSSRIAAALVLGLTLLLWPIANAQAAELQILAGGGMTGPLKELGALFESASGHKLVFRFGTTPELIKLATSGGPFDLGVVPREVFKDAAAQAQFAPEPTIDIARVGLGVAVRSGAWLDISTPAALKEALLKAQSIATTPASAAGAQVLRLFERLGISEAMKAKTKAQPGPAQIVQAVATGEAELGVFSRAHRPRSGPARSVPRRVAAGNRFHGRACRQHQGSGSRQGIHHLPEDSARHRGDEGQRHDSGLTMLGFGRNEAPASKGADDGSHLTALRTAMCMLVLLVTSQFTPAIAQTVRQLAQQDHVETATASSSTRTDACSSAVDKAFNLASSEVPPIFRA